MIYELTLRFDAETEQVALSAAMRLEDEIKRVTKTVDVPAIQFERLSRVVVTRMRFATGKSEQ